MSLVSVRRCEDYNQDQVDLAVAQALTDVEAEQLFSRGDTVLLKANLLSAKTPEQAVTTHPAVISALAKWFVIRGAKVQVGDSSAGISTGGVGGNTARALVVSGVETAARMAGAEVLNFDSAGSVPVGGGQVFQSVMIARPVIEADLVVSVPKLKTHALTLVTGAVKNMYGAVPGATKSEYHRQAPQVHTFCTGLVDVYQAARPGLALMDAIWGMEGNGPSAGTVRQRGLVLASRDPIALDAAACTLIGCPPERVLTTVLAAQRGLGSLNPQLVGDAVTPVNFRLPASARVTPLASRMFSMYYGLMNYIPGINPEVCTSCNECVRGCPTQALTPGEGMPGFRISDCIHCFCCHELCPRHAIDLVPKYPRANRVLRVLTRRRRSKND